MLCDVNSNADVFKGNDNQKDLSFLTTESSLLTHIDQRDQDGVV